MPKLPFVTDPDGCFFMWPRLPTSNPVALSYVKIDPAALVVRNRFDSVSPVLRGIAAEWLVLSQMAVMYSFQPETVG
jgi:hypothetical protein